MSQTKVQLVNDVSENVGIGTSSPSGASGKVLEINGGSGQARFVLKNSTTGSASTDGHQIFSDGTTLGIQNREAGNTTFETNGSERMRVDSSGRLLIGSTDGATHANSSTDDLIVGSSANGKNDGITILSGTAQNGTVAFADSGGSTQGLVGYVHNGDYLRFHAGDTLKVRIDTDGLKFNSDTAAANALNDYEEGNFNPTLPNGGGSVSFNVHTAKYIKIGNVVHIQCDISSIANHQNLDLRIGGFPFTSSSVNATTATVLTGRADPGNGLTVNVFDSSAFADVRSQFSSDGQKGQIFNGHGLHFNLTYVTN